MNANLDTEAEQDVEPKYDTEMQAGVENGTLRSLMSDPKFALFALQEAPEQRALSPKHLRLAFALISPRYLQFYGKYHSWWPRRAPG